jgi:hypothetical protein
MHWRENGRHIQTKKDYSFLTLRVSSFTDWPVQKDVERTQLVFIFWRMA